MLKDCFKNKWVSVIIFPAWVFFSFFAAQQITKGIIWSVNEISIGFFGLIDKTVFSAIISAIVYILTVLIAIFAPKFIRHVKTTKTEIGLSRLASWTDILLMPAGLIVYLILASTLIVIAQKIIPGFDVKQAQDVGFSHINRQYEVLLAFVTLVIVAPIAEEILFRGYLFGKLKKTIPVWLAIIVTSLSFGFIHGAWNLAIDTFALSVILCILRQITGNIWSPILLHMAKNGIAFYFLFINPSFLIH